MAGGKVAIIGGGAWGTALAVHLGRCGRPVGLWMRDEELVGRMIARRDNPAYLPGVPVPECVEPSSDLGQALAGAELVIPAVPSQFAREVYRALAPQLPAQLPVLVTCKGIEESTLALPLASP